MEKFKLNTTSVSLAVTPTVISTLFSHYLKREPLRERPTAHLSYDEGLHLIRSFLDFASQRTVEELQAFTSQWVPHPRWIKIEHATVSEAHLSHAADLLEANLGPDGIKEIGGKKWWQWRRPKSPLEAEWIEMKSDAAERKKLDKPCRRVMMYIHGGAYFFGSVDEHRYQMQRHARKLNARVFAPKYRLSPQFPFPCGLQDCLAAYLHLLTVHDPSHVVFAGDSAGGGMVLAVLCVLRDQGIPLPAGAILISPWVDLTHSFPSVAGDTPFDYIPQSGFHHKPSRSWPPPNEDDIEMMEEQVRKAKSGKGVKRADTADLEAKQQFAVVPESQEALDASTEPTQTSGGIASDAKQFLSITIDGELVIVKEQIQMYTTNTLLEHPLVSPVMQPSLGGLPPLLIMVGGGEILRDEQIYLAHKCANPKKYAPPSGKLTEKGREHLQKYKPTDVQLQVWDDLCHVAPTLSFTRPAKYMYRAVAQFGAWALAKAQHRGIEIMDDDQISVISNSGTESDVEPKAEDIPTRQESVQLGIEPGSVGKAGDALPSFKNHMIRQRVTRHGVTYQLAPEEELPGCCISPEEVGCIKVGPVKKWLETKKQWDSRFATTKAKVHKNLIKDKIAGVQDFGPGETPPPSALAGRVRVGEELAEKKKTRSLGLAMWSGWGSKHDEMTVDREQKAEQDFAKELPDDKPTTTEEGKEAQQSSDADDRKQSVVSNATGQERSRRRTVVDENQTGVLPVNEHTPIAELLSIRRAQETSDKDYLNVNSPPGVGVAGKRPFIDGIAMPFSLGKEADTASMVTLHSEAGPAPESRPMSSNRSLLEPSKLQQSTPAEEEDLDLSTPLAGPQRPGMETFVTAAEELPLVKSEISDAKTMVEN